jgi:hypothetical protein
MLPFDIEQRLAELASYHVRLFTDDASQLGTTAKAPALVARALPALIEEAKRAIAALSRID